MEGWFSQAELLPATEDEGESTEAEQGGGGGLGDGYLVCHGIEVPGCSVGVGNFKIYDQIFARHGGVVVVDVIDLV